MLEQLCGGGGVGGAGEEAGQQGAGREDAASQTESHPGTASLQPGYTSNEWELRRRALGITAALQTQFRKRNVTILRVIRY